MTAAVATNPLDVLKTRLQSDFYQATLISSRKTRGVPPLHTLSLVRASTLHIRETFQILFAVPRVEGWRALFKGLGPNLIGVVPARAINFYTYGNGKRIISEWGNEGKEVAWVHLSAAIVAGITTGTVTCPIWVVKTRMQLDKSTTEKRISSSSAGVSAATSSKKIQGSIQAQRRYKNAFDCTMQTLRYEGIRGLYRGLGASYLGVTESTLQWVLYEQMKSSLANREARIQASGRQKTAWDRTVEYTGKAGSAGIAKFFAAIVTYPHEVSSHTLHITISPSHGHTRAVTKSYLFRLSVPVSAKRLLPPLAKSSTRG